MGTLASGSGRQDLGNAAPRATGPVPYAALELRVHGVHGTSPASMLGVKDTRQVAGDGITGVFRAGTDLPRRTVRAGHAVEAYSWGALTSAVRGALGWVQRVLWLGLLPFALINLAYWARLHVGDDSRTGRWGAAAVRWAALLLTMLIVLTSCFISLDLVAWQCYRGGTKSCDVLPGQLDFMMFLAPSQRLAVASVVPLAGIWLMWFLSRQTLARYESCTDSTDEAPPPPPTQPEQESVPWRRRLAQAWAGARTRVGAWLKDRPAAWKRFWAKAKDPGREVQHLLRDSRFWSSTRRTTRLQRIHLAAAVATLMAYIGVQVWKLTDEPNPWTVMAVAILLSSFVAAVRLHPQDLEYYGPLPDEKGPRDRGAPWLVRLSVLFVLAQLVWLAWPLAEQSRRWDSDVAWWGHNLWFIGTFVALSAVGIAVFVAGRMNRWVAPAPIALFIAVVAYAAWLSVHDDGAVTRDELQALLTRSLFVAAVFFVCMLVWQWWQSLPARKRRDKAWYGAAPAVLIGAAGWIALLFTTAAVTAAAEYLNGPDQSVSDLTSVSGPDEDAAAREGVTDLARTPVVELSEGAVLRDGIVVLGKEPDGGAPSIIRGAVEVERAEAASGRLTENLPDTVLFIGTLEMEDATLLLVDTCWVTEPDDPPSACHPETKGFVSASTVTVLGQQLVVADDGRIRLSVAEPPTMPLVVPQVLIWAPIVQVLWAVLAGLIALVCFLQLKRRVYPRIKDLVDEDGVPTESRNDVRSKRLRAAYAHRAERLIELIGAMTVVCVLLLLCLSATGQPPNTLVSTLYPEWRSDLPHLVASLSLYVVLALSAGFVLLSSYVRRSEATRKAVGILWDLTTFWPRAAHPLSPPCYAERVVPELTTRIRWALRRRGRVVVSGHSQGSLIAAATLLRLEPEELEKVTFVTYGSQLRALYGRIFPRVLGPDVLGNKATEGSPKFKTVTPDVPEKPPGTTRPPGKDPKTLWDLLGADGWFNLFRRADPLGWRVFSDRDSDHDLVTPEVPPPRAGDPGPTVATHSGYQHTVEYRGVVCDWLRETLVEDSDWRIEDVRPLPEP